MNIDINIGVIFKPQHC